MNNQEWEAFIGIVIAVFSIIGASIIWIIFKSNSASLVTFLSSILGSIIALIILEEAEW